MATTTATTTRRVQGPASRGASGRVGRRACRCEGLSRRAGRPGGVAVRAVDGEGEGAGAGGEAPGGEDTFADQLWSAARQGVQDVETSQTLAVSASSFMNPITNQFDINGFFASAKSLYLKQ